MTKKILTSKIMIFILIVFAIYFPLTINMTKQTDRRTVVVAVGIDKNETDYTVSMQMIVPEASTSFKENLQVYSANGDNILQTIENLSIHIGKITGLGNLSAIVFGKEMAKQGIVETLDFFVRSKRINDNPTIITTNAKAKTLLEKVALIDNNFAYSVNSLAKLNKTSSNTGFSSVESFLSDYYSGTIASTVAQINQVADDNEGISTKSQDSSQTGGGSSSGATGATAGEEGQNQQQENNVLSNNGDTSIFVGGKEVAVFDAQQMRGFGILTRESQRAVFTLKNVSDNFLNNAEIVMSLRSKFISREYTFKNGVPQVKNHVKLIVKIEQIRQENKDLDQMDGTYDYLTDEVKRLLKLQIVNQISESINLSKQYNADILKVQDMFYKFKHDQWNKYLKTLPDKTEAYKNIEFFTDIQVSGNL